MKFLFIAISSLLPHIGFSQKPAIDISTFDKWQSVRNVIISNDGNYVAYGVHNIPHGEHTVTVKSTSNKWTVQIQGASQCRFSGDNHRLIFAKGDSIGILRLGTDFISYLEGVQSFSTTDNGNKTWLGYLKAGDRNEFILTEPNLKLTKSYPNVKEYVFSESGEILLLAVELAGKAGTSRELIWIDLETGREHVIWSGLACSNFVFDASFQVAFSGQVDSVDNTVIYYYKKGMQSAIQTIHSENTKIESNWVIARPFRFSNDHRSLFFYLQKKKEPTIERAGVDVDVWSYMDPKLQSLQLKELDMPPAECLAIVDLEKDRTVRLQFENETCITLFSGEFDDEQILIQRNGQGHAESEWFWNTESLVSIYVVSTETGKRTKLKSDLPQLSYLSTYKLSPKGDFVFFYDCDQEAYFSYELSTHKLRNLTEDVHTNWISQHETDLPRRQYAPVGIAGFLDDGRNVLVYDQTDVWMVDLSARQKPINLTAGYGAKQNIVFRLAREVYYETISSGQNLLLTAFNTVNKEEGFYDLTFAARPHLEKLFSGPFLFVGNGGDVDVDIFYPVKARHANKFVVRRMALSSSPNYFFTSDFRKFSTVSDVSPERQFNWLSSELLTWTADDGNVYRGLLYKPENFDSKKKYPVIFHYYEKMSDGLNKYISPDYCMGPMNIPFFVSNGFLVFTPDIHYVIGDPCASVVDAVGSAAKYLSGFPFVDSTKLGLQGHSRGGYETNCLITNTKRFAAACSASGLSDYITLYGGIKSSGISTHVSYEFNFQRIGSTLWESPDRYIRNSPIFRTHYVSTPLLIMHNELDGDIPFSQSVEIFTALRRLGKRVWMLQYDREGHAVQSESAKRDYTLKMKQFFDHYLKDSSAPKWMTHVTPAKMKGINNKPELDYEGKSPSEGCLLTEEAKKKAALLQRRKPVRVTIE